MEKFKTPRIDAQNTISFTCSDDAVEPILEFLNKLKSLGEMGCSRTVKINWDGDGRDRVNYVSINGMSLKDWNDEWERLENLNISKQYLTQNKNEKKNKYERKTTNIIR